MNNGNWEDLGLKQTLSYREAIEWIVANDNMRWLEAGPLSRAASVIADMFGRSDETIRNDLRAKIKQIDQAKERQTL